MAKMDIKWLNNLVIDDDGESIDGSNTPMVNAHDELVTRAYVQSISAQAEDILYADLVTAIAAGSLVSGKYYRITDYLHGNYQDESETTIYTINHPIIVQAINSDTLSASAVDPIYTDDLISYSVDNEGVSTTGVIIYRHDLRRNIKGNFDWRLQRFERWTADTSNTDYAGTDYDILPENNNVYGVGKNYDGSLIDLQPIGSAGLYPVVDDASTYAMNTEFVDCVNLVLDCNGNTYGPQNCYFYNIQHSTIVHRGGADRIQNLNLNSVKHLFLLHGADDLTINQYGFISLNLLFSSLTTKCKFDRAQTVAFGVISDMIFKGDLNVSLFTGDIRNSIAESGSSGMSFNIRGDYRNNVIKADFIDVNTLISGGLGNGDFIGNNINVSDAFRIYADNYFTNNVISTNRFENIELVSMDNNVISGSYANVDFSIINNTKLEDTLLGAGFPSPDPDETYFNIDGGISSTDDTDDGAVLLDISNTYTIDTNIFSYYMELPSKPQNGLEITLYDSTASCFNNPFTLRVSSNPDASTINTINDNIEIKIDSNFGFLRVIYDETAGWLVSTQSVVPTEVDDITIEETAAQMVSTTAQTSGTSVGNWLSHAFTPISDESNWSMAWGTFNTNNEFTSQDNHGVHYIDLNRDSTSPFDIWEVGTYYLYLTVQVDAANGGTVFMQSTDDGVPNSHYTWNATDAGTEVINSVTYYKYQFDITDTGTDQDRKIVFLEIYPSDLQSTEFKVRQFKATSVYHPASHTIKEIDYIIDDDNESIDGSNTPMSNANRELVTRAYIDGVAGSAAFVNLDEGSGTGYIVQGRDPANFGNIGLNSLDISNSTGPSTTVGALGKSDIVSGDNNEVSGDYSYVNGKNNVISGPGNIVTGNSNTSAGNNARISGTHNVVGDGENNVLRGNGNQALSSAYANIIFGDSNICDDGQGNIITGTGNLIDGSSVLASGSGNSTDNNSNNIILKGQNNSVITSKGSVVIGDTNSIKNSNFSFLQGEHLISDTPHQMWLGKFNNKTEPAVRFGIGDGPDEANRSNVFEVRDGGTTIVPSLSISDITENRQLVTKEYVDSLSHGVDNVTIEEITGSLQTAFGYEADINDCINNNWVDGIDYEWEDRPSEGCTFVDGAWNVTNYKGEWHIQSYDSTNQSSNKLWSPTKYYAAVSIDPNPVNLNVRLRTSLGVYHSSVSLGEYGSTGYYVIEFDLTAATGEDLRITQLYSNDGQEDWHMYLLSSERYPIKSVHSIKEIDYIIDDDDESIDGSDSPMIDPHREIVTRAYVDANSHGVDDVTIEEIGGGTLTTNNFTSGFSHQEWLESSFWPLSEQWDLVASTYASNSGIFDVGNGVVFELNIHNSNHEYWPETTYVFHTSKSAEANGINFSLVSASGASYISNEINEEIPGWWRQEIVIPVGTLQEDTEIIDFVASSGPTDYQIRQYTNTTTTIIPTEHTVKNIDYIIDDDNESIDGSDTPMSDAHRELITRSYVDGMFASNAHWQKISNELTPVDGLVDSIAWHKNFNGYTKMTMTNEDDTGNGAGSVIEVKGSGAAYTNNLYMGKYGASFWIPMLADNGAVMTDKNMIFGSVTDGSETIILAGGGYGDPTSVAKFDIDGLHIESNKAIAPNIYVEDLKNQQAHPATYNSLFVDDTTGKIYSGPVAVEATETTERFTITAADVANGYITIANVPNTTKHIFVIHNGLVLDMDPAGDFTLSGAQINFIANIVVDDKILVKYSY